jgi:hypothetical protein
VSVPVPCAAYMMTPGEYDVMVEPVNVADSDSARNVGAEFVRNCGAVVNAFDGIKNSPSVPVAEPFTTCELDV